MGQNISKVMPENETIKLKRILEEQGPASLDKYINESLNQWQTEAVTFAVTGRTATGKSRFINTMRNVKYNETGFAPTGSGNTTTEPQVYQHPKNPKILYYDLPGVGTLVFNKETYVENMKLRSFDYFLIFFNTVLSEDDYWVIEQIHDLGKTYCLVRSMIDKDVENAQYDGKSKKDVIENIRQTIKNEWKNPKYTLLQNSKAMFIISSRDQTLGDMDTLIDHMEANLPSLKFEVIMNSLESISEKIIEKKCSVLKKRISWVAAVACGISAVPVPFLDIMVNLAILYKEVRHYIDVFGLSETKLATLIGFDKKQLKCNELLSANKEEKMQYMYFISCHLKSYLIRATIESVADIIIPFIGSYISAKTTVSFVYRFLESLINDLVADSKLVFKFIKEEERKKLDKRQKTN